MEMGLMEGLLGFVEDPLPEVFVVHLHGPGRSVLLLCCWSAAKNNVASVFTDSLLSAGFYAFLWKFSN